MAETWAYGTVTTTGNAGIFLFKLTDTVYGAKLNARYGFEAVARREPDEEGQDRFTLMIYKNREAVENDPPLYHFTTPIHR